MEMTTNKCVMFFRQSFHYVDGKRKKKHGWTTLTLRKGAKGLGGIVYERDGWDNTTARAEMHRFAIESAQVLGLDVVAVSRGTNDFEEL